MQKITFSRATLDVWKRAFDFKGYSSRQEFWFGLLGILLVNIIAFGLSTYSPIFTLVIVVNNFSLIATFIRRLRDAGYSPWLFLLILVPVISLLIFYFNSKPTKNR